MTIDQEIQAFVDSKPWQKNTGNVVRYSLTNVVNRLALQTFSTLSKSDYKDFVKGLEDDRLTRSKRKGMRLNLRLMLEYLHPDWNLRGKRKIPEKAKPKPDIEPLPPADFEKIQEFVKSDQPWDSPFHSRENTPTSTFNSEVERIINACGRSDVLTGVVVNV